MESVHACIDSCQYVDPPFPSNLQMEYWDGKKYADFGLPSESCTLAIVMLNDFRHGSLPGEVPLKTWGSDTATFLQLWKAAKRVENDCLLEGRKPGWQSAGKP